MVRTAAASAMIVFLGLLLAGYSPDVGSGAACGGEAATDSPPNVVLIFADDVGYGDVGCYGATKVNTPNIDRLAKEGRRFTDAHSASAVCTPSRYALMTGDYPFRRNLWPPVFHKTGLLIDPDRLTLASLMKDAPSLLILDSRTPASVVATATSSTNSTGSSERCLRLSTNTVWPTTRW